LAESALLTRFGQVTIIVFVSK